MPVAKTELELLEDIKGILRLIMMGIWALVGVMIVHK